MKRFAIFLLFLCGCLPPPKPLPSLPPDTTIKTVLKTVKRSSEYNKFEIEWVTEQKEWFRRLITPNHVYLDLPKGENPWFDETIIYRRHTQAVWVYQTKTVTINLHLPENFK